MPKDVGRKYWIEIATMIVCAIIAAVPSYLTFFKGNEPPAFSEQPIRYSEPRPPATQNGDDHVSIPLKAASLEPMPAKQLVSKEALDTNLTPLESDTSPQPAVEERPKAASDVSVIPAAISGSSGQVEATSGQAETTSGQAETTSSQVEATSGQVEATSGQVEATSGQVTVCDKHFDILVQPALHKIVLTETGGTEHYLTEGLSVILMGDCHLTMTNIKKTFGGAVAQLKWSTHN